jgi:hypothetical protein
VTSPGRAPTEQSSEAVLELTVHLGLGAQHDLALRNDHDVEGDVTHGNMPPEALAQEALRPVARDRRPHAPTDGQPQPVIPAVILRRHELVERPVQPAARPKDPAELPGTLEPLRGPEARPLAQAESRFRPFWRRRFNTSRPPFVRIRTRKPWVRLRLRLFGWNVLFMVEPRRRPEPAR